MSANISAESLLLAIETIRNREHHQSSLRPDEICERILNFARELEFVRAIDIKD